MGKLTLVLSLIGLLSAGIAQAQTQTLVIQNGQVNSGKTLPGGEVTINGGQHLFLEAAGKVMAGDFKAAEALYSQSIAMDNGNADAYVQRGIIRRELHDQVGAEADGKAAVILADRALQRAPRNANYYYQRAMGYRLQRQFDQAKNDLLSALKLQSNASWENDLKAIEVEKKIAQ